MASRRHAPSRAAAVEPRQDPECRLNDNPETPKRNWANNQHDALYLDRSLAALRARGTVIDDALLPHLSPLGWDHINLTGDYVWSDALPLDDDGYMPLKMPPI